VCLVIGVEGLTVAVLVLLVVRQFAPWPFHYTSVYR